MRPIEREFSAAIHPVTRHLKAFFEKRMSSQVCDEFVDAFIQNLGDRKITALDACEKREKGKTRLVVCGQEKMTFAEILEYLDEWRDKKGMDSLEQRISLMLKEFLRSEAKGVFEETLLHGAGPWKKFLHNGEVPVPDPEWVKNPENSMPLLRDCLPLSHEAGKYILINYYGALLMNAEQGCDNEIMELYKAICALACANPEEDKFFMAFNSFRDSLADKRRLELANETSRFFIAEMRSWQGDDLAFFLDQMREMTDAIIERRKMILDAGFDIRETMRDGIVPEEENLEEPAQLSLF